MNALDGDLSKAVESILPLYLQAWTRQVICELEQAEGEPTNSEPVLGRSVNAMAKCFRKRDLEKPHCLTCGALFENLSLVAQHLHDTLQCKICKQEFVSPKLAATHSESKEHQICSFALSHIYSLKRLKREVKHVRKLKFAVNALGVSMEESSQQMLRLLRVGIALKVATLVRLHGSNDKKRAFEKRVRKIVGSL
jgi:hypothetical protein